MDCIEWLGPPTNSGYGQLTVDKRHWMAHRYAWTQVNGPIPEGMIVMHTCDNKLCVNPEHLRLGTHHDNMADMVAKGRHRGANITHCPQGHEYTEENTYRSGRGIERQCRACRRDQQVKVAARRKEERHSRREIYQGREHTQEEEGLGTRVQEREEAWRVSRERHPAGQRHSKER